MPLEVLSTPYGRPALERLRASVAAAKGSDPLAPVGVVVPSNHVGVTARRVLASGGLGPGTRAGVAAVTFLTAYRLAERGRDPVEAALDAGLARMLLEALGVSNRQRCEVRERL